LQEETHLLPRLEAQGEPVDDITKRQLEELEGHIKAMDKALAAEEIHIKFLLHVDKNCALEFGLIRHISLKNLRALFFVAY
jgi:hypothetical protein